MASAKSESRLRTTSAKLADFERRRTALRNASVVALVLMAGACKESLDAGSSNPKGLLPVDSRNPVILVNDTAKDNWQGEYAMLLANSGGPALAGIVVVAPPPWSDLDANTAGWMDLVTAARKSGMKDIPDPVRSASPALVRPDNGDIDSTAFTRSDGAVFIVNASKRLALPYRPVVVATGTALTDVANAYRIDPTVADRVVVVASLGTVKATGGSMNSPNGNLDTWADTIVASRFRYVQVSAFYDQLTDVPDSGVSDLPANDFGKWMATKQPNLWHWQPASDQVAIAASGILGFSTAVMRVSLTVSIDAGATDSPELMPDTDGKGWLVTQCDGAIATKRLWTMLADPKTFGH